MGCPTIEDECGVCSEDCCGCIRGSVKWSASHPLGGSWEGFATRDGTQSCFWKGLGEDEDGEYAFDIALCIPGPLHKIFGFEHAGLEIGDSGDIPQDDCTMGGSVVTGTGWVLSVT